MKRTSRLALLGALLATVGCGAQPTSTADGLTGAGSTFVYDIMDKWGREYERREGGCKVTYHAWGSSGGVQFITEKKGDFGCTDAPLTDEELAAVRAAGDEVVHVPLVLGAVVAVYNLAEVNEPLRFTGPVLADIFLGKIKRWNAEALRDLNPGLKLPDQEILVVHRLDGSGTTDIWTDYLCKVSPEWKRGPGRGREVKWPTGKGESGNENVAEYVRRTAGSIGYVELSYAHRKDLAFGLVQNREGKFVRARMESVTAAAEDALVEVPDDLRFSLTNAPGKTSYPISGATWAVLYLHQPHRKGQELLDFLRWVLEDGQQYAESQFYARLPDALAVRALRKLNQVQVAE
ncbi:MAG TPA: phosphate ABC transporter substrate-binding protein PstS [Gemmataceae bacterium]|nr:phosphate ABC transporter substrate-binding protein PstS [Gemmataceae bacterium]